MSGLSPERIKALGEWVAQLMPQEAVKVRAIVRNCGNCVHYSGTGSDALGSCLVNPPSTFAVESSLFPVVIPEAHCGRWQHPQLPLSWLSGLSPVELERAASVMGAEVPSV